LEAVHTFVTLCPCYLIEGFPLQAVNVFNRMAPHNGRWQMFMCAVKLNNYCGVVNC